MRALLCAVLVATPALAETHFDYRFSATVEPQFGELPSLSFSGSPQVPAPLLLGARVDLGLRFGARVFVAPFLGGGAGIVCNVQQCLFYRLGLSTLVHLGDVSVAHPWVALGAGFQLLSMAVDMGGGFVDHPTAEGGFGELRFGYEFPLGDSARIAPVLGAELGAYRLKGTHPQGNVSAGVAFRF